MKVKASLAIVIALSQAIMHIETGQHTFADSSAVTALSQVGIVVNPVLLIVATFRRFGAS